MRLSCPHAVMRVGTVFAKAVTRVSPRASTFEAACGA